MNEEFKEWRSTAQHYKFLNKWNPSLIQMILDRHPSKENKVHGFISRIITGEPGNGKSMYAYKLLAKLIYVIHGYTTIDDEEEAYKEALDNIIYPVDDFLKRIERTIYSGDPDWCWCLDDCSIHMGKQLWNQNRDAYWRLEDTLPTIRENVTCLLVTTPKMNGLAKPFRDFFDKKINMVAEHGIKQFDRTGKHYIKEYFPDDIRFRIYHPYDDRFSCLCPEPFYTWYREKKKKALITYHESKKKRPVKPTGEDEDVES